VQTYISPSSALQLHTNNVQNSYAALQNTEKYLPNTKHRPASGSKQPHVNQYMRLALKIQIPTHDADHLHLSSNENGWSYTGAPPIHGYGVQSDLTFPFT